MSVYFYKLIFNKLYPKQIENAIRLKGTEKKGRERCKKLLNLPFTKTEEVFSCNMACSKVCHQIKQDYQFIKS